MIWACRMLWCCSRSQVAGDALCAALQSMVPRQLAQSARRVVSPPGGLRNALQRQPHLLT